MLEGGGVIRHGIYEASLAGVPANAKTHPEGAGEIDHKRRLDVNSGAVDCAVAAVV